MAYVTGTANSQADLLTAIQNACTANGWTLSGSVLHKGTCYVELSTYSTHQLSVQGGSGQTGGALTGRSDSPAAYLGADVRNVSGRIHADVPFSFPVEYSVHVGVSPDEVYVVVKYATSCYQALAFGQSPMPGLHGTGNWYVATNCETFRNQTLGLDLRQYGGSSWNPGFWMIYPGGNYGRNGAVDHQLDSATWAINDGAGRDWASLQARQPSQWNQESILIPMRVYATRPSNYVSPVLEHAHARFVSIANLQDEQIITLGSDRWRVYPWWQRGDPYNFNTDYGSNSGIYGYAIRYDGP